MCKYLQKAGWVFCNLKAKVQSSWVSQASSVWNCAPVCTNAPSGAGRPKHLQGQLQGQVAGDAGRGRERGEAGEGSHGEKLGTLPESHEKTQKNVTRFWRWPSGKTWSDLSFGLTGARVHAGRSLSSGEQAPCARRWWQDQGEDNGNRQKKFNL